MTDTQNYTVLSDQIKTVKGNIITELATLHNDMVALAGLEKALEVERQNNVERINGLQVNSPDLGAAIALHSTQAQIPVMGVWSKVNDAISLIYQNTTDARSTLPELYARGNRIEDITVGKV